MDSLFSSKNRRNYQAYNETTTRRNYVCCCCPRDPSRGQDHHHCRMGAHSEQAHPQCLGPVQADLEQIQEDVDHQEVVEKGESTWAFLFRKNYTLCNETY